MAREEKSTAASPKAASPTIRLLTAHGFRYHRRGFKARFPMAGGLQREGVV